MFFLAALSASFIAALTFSAVFDFLAIRIAASKDALMEVLIDNFCLEPRRALLAVFVTGMTRV